MEYILKVQMLQGPLKGNTMQIECLERLAVGTKHTFGEHTFLVLDSKENPL
jgi:hypothetical protein